MKRMHGAARPSVGALGLVALLIVGMAAGCGKDDESTTPQPPGTLTFVNGDGQVTLSWGGSSSAGDAVFAGYDVFRDTSSMIGLDLASLTEKKLNASPLTVRSYIDATAVNGTMYYYAVRSAKTGGGWSTPTNEIDTSPVTRSNLVLLAEFADPVRPSGLDVSAGAAVSVRQENLMQVDIYLGTAGDNDESTQQLALKSPNLVNAGDPAWSARVAQFKLLPNEDSSTTEISGWQDRILLGTNAQQITSKVIAVRTPPDGAGQVHYGKIIVYSTAGPQGQRQIEVFSTFQQIPNYIRF